MPFINDYMEKQIFFLSIYHRVILAASVYDNSVYDLLNLLLNDWHCELFIWTSLTNLMVFDAINVQIC